MDWRSSGGGRQAGEEEERKGARHRKEEWRATKMSGLYRELESSRLGQGMPGGDGGMLGGAEAGSALMGKRHTSVLC